MAEDKMENGYELWLKCCDNTKSGEVKRFLEVPLIKRRSLDEKVYGALDKTRTG
jgi:hypothetical protein